MHKAIFNRSILFFILTFASLSGFGQQNLQVHSPNGSLKVDLLLQNGAPVYTLSFEDEIFLEKSPLGLKTSISDFAGELSYVSHSEKKLNEVYTLMHGKKSQIDYRANELSSNYVSSSGDTLQVIFRLSNTDVAFSYGIKGGNGQTNVIVQEEKTGFNLPNNATVYLTPQALPMTGWEETKPSYEENYLFDKPLGTPSEYGVGFTFPALFRLNDSGWMLISETGVDSHYVGSRLGEGNEEGLYSIEFPQPGENNGIGDNFAALALPAYTPWRTITIGKTLKSIVESTVAFDVVLPKYEAAKQYIPGRASWSWIVWQDASINYEDQIKFIDLAASLDFEYVLIDNWWDNNIGRDRMEELVLYAGSKDVGVLLWYNSNGYWNNAPQTPQDRMNTAPARNREMQWLKDIGVKGIKVDFFGGDKQHTIKLYEDILTDANNYGLIVNFHGSTLPRGWERMYPNFVTSEAVLASENLVFTQEASDLHAYKATILPFIRNAVGAMDFAPVFLNKRLTRDQNAGSVRRTTDAFELATAVLYFSPLQHFGLTPNNLDEQPEYVLDFLRQVPTTWDDTVFIDGIPGEYCVIARRKGDKWFVAAVNGEKNEKVLELDLPMLKGSTLQLIYDKTDRSAGEKELKVGDNSKVKITLLPEGGALLMGEEVGKI